MKKVMKLCAVLCVLQMSSVAIAQDTNWTNVGGDAEWTNDLNWSSGAAVAGTNFLTNIALPAANVTTPGVLASRLVLDTGGAIDIQAGADLDVIGGASQILMGNGPGSSSINVDGGLQNDNVFAVGTNAGGVGSVTVGAAGTVDVINPGAWLLVGFNAGAAGTLDVNGGTVNVAGFSAAGWAGDGDITVNNGGSYNVFGVMNVAVADATANGTIVINDGQISSSGLNLGDNLGASGSLLIEALGTYNNFGGFVQSPGFTVSINGTGRFIFDASVSPLGDVQALVNGNPDWIFSDGPSITESAGFVTVTNIPEPASLVLLSSMALAGLAIRRRR